MQLALPFTQDDLFVDDASKDVPKDVVDDEPRDSPEEAMALEMKRRQLQLELKLHLDAPVAVVLNANRQSMLSAQRTRLGYYFRLHRIFTDATPDVVMALANMVGKNDTQAARYIDCFIDQHSDAIAKHAKLSPVQTQGSHFDLELVFVRLNGKYFDDRVNARITWGRTGGTRRRSGRSRSIKLGSFHAGERLIRIHPALDQSFVPPYFLDYVVFHEMLHEQLGIAERTQEGRRCVHPPEFRALEARFPHASDAQRWEREHIGRLLRFTAR